MQKIKYVSQKEAERIEPNDKTLMISIRDPGQTVRLKEGWRHLVVIECDDLCPEECKAIGRKDLIKSSKFFVEKDALKIKAAVDNFDGPIIVHCKAGVSRSGAVAKALSEKFNDDRLVFGNINPHIYKIMKGVL